MVNPFWVPGLANQRAPLCPWHDPDHLKHYVAYGAVGGAMDYFTEYLSDWEGGQGPGRLIVVTGESSCGKTSLAHWCAFHLDRVKNQAIGRRAGKFVLDLSGYHYLPAHSDDSGSTERAAQICAKAVAALRDGRQVAVPGSWLAGSGRPEYDYRRIYEELATRARKVRFTPIIIIPQISGFVNDVEEYLYLAATYANIVFITESSDDLVTRRIRQEHDEQDRVVWLRLGPMSEDDGWRFVEELLSRCEVVPGMRIGKSDVTALMRQMIRINANSPRKLRRILCSAWEHREKESPNGMVTADDLLAQLIPRSDASAVG